MRHVEFNPDTDLTPEQKVWWDNWISKAEKACKVLIDEYNATGELKFNNDIWSELKKFLLETVFHHKCAYCETKISPGFYGDAEHFRPKGKVTHLTNETVIPVEVNGKLHPGYYWLAYDWRNLFPACERCNRGDGKMNQFPISGSYVANPDTAPDIDALNRIEKPLLLNPYEDNPSQHIHFIEKGEVIVVRESSKGNESIGVFKLDRALTVSDRSERQELAVDRYKLAIGEHLTNGKPLSESMEIFVGPGAPYSQAVRDYLIKKREKIIAELTKEL